MSAEDYLPLLKRSHLFFGLSDDQILDFARRLKAERREAKEIIFKQHEAGDRLYFIVRGCVKVMRQEGNTLRTLATFETGDHFGMAALLERKPRSATIVAECETDLLRLNREDFLTLLKRYPQIRPNLQADVRTQKLNRQLKFNWLLPSEVVYLIARRHGVLLAQSLAVPAILLMLLLIGGLILYPLVGLTTALIILAVGAVPLGLWAVWKWVDWGNDYYIVTNLRVVYLEKVVGLYDSRQESPLTSILSVNVQSVDALERALDMGDVIVRTYTGLITMDSVPRPKALANLVEEYWARAKEGARLAEQEFVREAVRRTLQPPAPAPPPPPPAPNKPARPVPLTERLARFFSLKVRYEVGDNIIYRKHWFLLLRDIWLQSVLIVLTVLGMVLVGVASSIPQMYQVPLLVLGALALLGFAAWWLYEFVDWQNDIYQIATDQIVDIIRKPLSREVRKSAPLGNVLSLRYERVGLLGLLFNYGTVIANIGTAEFRFDGVFDPKGVQNDIYRRMETLNARKVQAETDKRRQEISQWIGAYHTIVKEMREENPPLPPVKS